MSCKVLLLQEKGFSSHNSYSLSKLASMMFTCDLAEHMKPKGVTVNCLDPGTVNTKMLIAGQHIKTTLLSTVRQFNSVVYLHALPEAFTRYSLYMKPHSVLCPSLLLSSCLPRHCCKQNVQLLICTPCLSHCSH